MDKQIGKPRAMALLPIGVFLLVFIGSGVIMKNLSAMPAVVGFLIALVTAFCQNPKRSFSDKLETVSQGIGDVNIVTMCLVFLCAGAFSGAVSAAGGADSTVNLSLSLIPPRFAVVGLFVIACFISISMGTSMGTIAALAPIAVGFSEKAGFSLAICTAAVVSGAMFGDNLSMISDTTIAAVRTQGGQMRDKFKANFLIALPAAILTAVLLGALTWGMEVETAGLEYDLLQVLPYVAVLIGALCGINVFVVLLGGTVLSLVVGVCTGAMAPSEMFTAVGGGVTGMYDITVISILVAGISALVRENGGFAFLLDTVRRRVKSRRGAELGIVSLISVTDVATANNTIAIVLAGPIVKEIAVEYDISPRRSASLLDIFASVFQGLIPYGAQLLSAASLTKLSPFQVMPYLYYPMLLAVCALVTVLWPRRKVL